MANPGRGEVALVVSGARITLRFTTSALVSLQDAWGYPYSPEGFQEFSARLQAAAATDLPMVVSYGGQGALGALRDVSVASALLGQAREDETRSAVARALTLAFPPPAPDRAEKAEPFSWESLLEVALRCAIPPRTFWTETPRGVTQLISAATWRRDREWEMVWLNAAWSRMGAKLPALSSVLSKGKSQGGGLKLTADAAVTLIAAVWGTPLIDPNKAAN